MVPHLTPTAESNEKTRAHTRDMIRSCINRSGSALASSSGLKPRPSRISAHAAYSTGSDRDAQINFDSLSAKGQAITQLFDSAERRKFIELQRKKVLPFDNMFSAAWVYICLQNPLLKKYRIDPDEVLKGAKYGFEVTYRAMFAADLRDFALGETKESASNDLLADTFNSRLYAAALGAAQDTKTKNVTSNIIELDFINVTLRNVMTQIVPGDVPEETEFMTDEERSLWLDMFPELKKGTTAKAGETEAGNVANATPVGGSTDAVSTNAAAPVVKVVETTPAATALAKPASPAAAASSSSSSSSIDSSAEKVVFSPQPATRAALKSVAPKPVEPAVVAATTNSSAAPILNAQATSTSGAATEPTLNSSSTGSAETASAADAQTAEGTENTSDTSDDPTVAPKEKFLSAYPPGSVVATVDIQFDIREEYETTMGGVEGALSTIKHARTTAPLWTFRGCISGQVPLQWRVVAFNGVGSQNSKY